MAEFKATASQKEAIETRGSAVLVSAGAGSGKTRVLTERLMGYICDEKQPVDVDSFLIITYTKAAAAELRGRIMEEISARLAAQPNNRGLRRQNALCQRAQIGTIHSFCARLIRDNCQQLGLAPDFKVAEEERSAAMRLAALERVLEKRYDRIDDMPDFRLLADTVGEGRDDSKLTELVLNLHSRMQCHPRPDAWAREQVELLRAPAEDVGQTPWGREVLDWAAEKAEFYASEMDSLIQAMVPVPEISAVYLENFSKSADEIRELCRCLRIGWDRARECFPIAFDRLRPLRKSPDPALSDMLKARRTAVKEGLEKLRESFAADSAQLLSELGQTAGAMEELLRLTLDFDREYARDKRRRSLLDYSDLEHFAVELLLDEEGRPTATAKQLQHRFTEIMVDEYQDVSRVQDSIFSAISNNGQNLFLVGDVKQSIYRFRLADPEIFNEKYRAWAPSEEAEPFEPRRILLRENFRSRREVLHGANSVFYNCMSRRLGDMDYDENAALVCGASWYENEGVKPEMLLIPIEESEEGESPDKTRLEAAFVAAKIKQLIQSGAMVTVPGGERPMNYGDICILLRSANTVGGIYRQELSRLGIPAGSNQSGEFFESLEISTVISMLAVMDNPHKDVALIAVLRSACFGFTPDELSEIRSADRRTDLYSALVKAAEENEKCRDFLKKLEQLRTLAPDLSAAELVWLVMEQLDLLALCSAMEDGSQRRARLMELVELAEGFESTEHRGLHRFVNWLRALQKKGQELSLGGSFSSAVQIMTIHKSKGLEFPVVFLSDTNKRFNTRDRQETVLVHPRLGLGPKLVDLERRVKYPTIARIAITRAMEREDMSEEMRLLYVALTRAKERLYITAAMKKPEEQMEKAMINATRPVSAEVLMRAGSMAGWLIHAFLADGGEHLKLSLCLPEQEEAGESGDFAPVPADGQAAELLSRRLSFVYPHAAAVELPSKVTATELKGRMEHDGDADSLIKPGSFSFPMPELGSGERPLNAAERGVATHLVLQYMDFSKAKSREGIKAEVQRLEKERFISQREAKAVNVSAIERLFSSELGKRMMKAEKLLREFRFSLLLPAESLYPGAEGEELLLQGVVDCCMEEDEQLVIIDYKTDNVRSDEEILSRAEHYRPQLQAYSKALERILGKRVKECRLFFLSPGREIGL